MNVLVYFYYSHKISLGYGPSGISVVGNVIYALGFNVNRLYKITLDSNDALVNQVILASSGLGMPVSIYVVGSQILVTCYSSHNVKMYDLDGNVIFTHGSGGSGTGQLNMAYGAHIDKWGRSYISDRGNNRIAVVSEDGTHMRYLVTSAEGLTGGPVGLVIEGNIMYVATASSPYRFYKFMIQ